MRRLFSSQFLRFCIVGASGTLLDFVVYGALLYGIHVHYLFASIGGFALAVCWNFFWNRRFTFQEQRRNVWEQFHDYLTIALVGVGLHIVVLWSLVEMGSLDPTVAKVMATAVVLLWNFFGNKYVTFSYHELGVSPFPALGTPLVSLIIPCFNEERRIGTTLQEIESYLHTKTWNLECIIVNDGSTDATVRVIEETMKTCTYPYSLVNLPKNRGKGAAVQAGVCEATGQFVLVMDADHSTHIREIERFWEVAEQEPESILIGSRYLEKGSIQTKQSVLRRGISRIGNLCIRALLLPSVRDSQCGFKWFPREYAKQLFAGLRSTGFAYDFEILARAKRRGMTVRELPITWNNHEESKVRLIADPVRMLWDLVYVRCTLWRDRI